MNKEAILNLVKQHLAAGLFPGASLSLYQEGQWQDFYLGLADPERNLASQPGLVYDLASVSKVVGVGHLMLDLLGHGLFEMDQALAELYPPMLQKEVTLRQLLTHTSGLDPFIPHRDELDAAGLKRALENLSLREDRDFHYTDVNFLLLGFFLEHYYDQNLDQLFEDKIFAPWGMSDTRFGPIGQAVPTVRGQQVGLVHDPKARVLGRHAGSAGLFSTVKDLQIFLQHYLTDDFAAILPRNYAISSNKTRSLAWNLEGDWLDHTGYTGTFIMFNRTRQEAAIFLSNRIYERDERAYWIAKRNEIMDLIRTS